MLDREKRGSGPFSAKAKTLAKAGKTQKSGASQPAIAYVGTKAIASVQLPINSMEATSIALRPIRSPKWPNVIAPNGRATNAMPKLIKASKVCAAGDFVGKNSGPKTSAAA